MKIVIDDKIPYIRETLQSLADQVVALPGARISPADVADADALIVRTRTRCDEQLLAGSQVCFVATATIGFDHIDADYLQRAGIAWTSCPGCNAGSVAQYVESSLLLLQQQKGLRLSGSTIGIVGCGHVGQQVLAVAQRLGMRPLVCDPRVGRSDYGSVAQYVESSLLLLQQQKGFRLSGSTIGIVGCGHVGQQVLAVAQRLGMRPLVCDPPIGLPDYVSLDVIAREADVITFHVPLTRQGDYPTWHMADEEFFHLLAREPYIINTSRGAVVDNAALLSALRECRVRDAVVDVWENEPNINLQLLQRVFIATPHIAGYSADGKVNADNMVIQALCRHFHLPQPAPIVPPPLPADFPYTGSPLELYNPLDDSRRLKNAPDQFESLRNNYPLRREKR